MDDEARRATVAALLQLADSHDFQDRADAGRALASFAEMPEAERRLQLLLLDAADTFVTRETAETLLRRKDAVGLAAVARALAEADANHADWIYTAVCDVFAIFARERDEAVRTCDVLIADGDPPLRRGALLVRDVLTTLDPVLRPAPDR